MVFELRPYCQVSSEPYGGIGIDNSIIMSKARLDHPNTQPHTDINSVCTLQKQEYCCTRCELYSQANEDMPIMHPYSGLVIVISEFTAISMNALPVHYKQTTRANVSLIC